MSRKSNEGDMQFIDSHCHLHDMQFYPHGREEVYERAAEQHVGMLLVGTSERDSHEAVKFAMEHEQSWAVVGVHPHDTKDGYAEIETLLATQTSEIIGVGEVGLDYYYTHSPREVQLRALEAQLQFAVTYNKPVSFHVRDAFDDFWPMFDAFSGLRGVLHSFTDTDTQLEKALTRGLYIGVNGISTFTKDEVQRQMFDHIPLERMLLETDAPFLTPKPYRGKVNEPVLVREVAQYHAERRQCSVEDIASKTVANTRELFAI